MKRILSFFLAVIMVISTGITAFAVEGDFTGKTIVLHTNDVHGKIEDYAKVAAIAKEYEAAGAEVILADAGDYSQGTVYVSLSKGANAVTMMNAVGYDVATLGNHEFDYGWAQLKSNLTSANFKVLCANILENGASIYDGYTIIEKGDVKVGFFGLDTPEAQTKTNPALIQGLDFLTGDALYDCANEQIAALEAAGADIIICLSHLGVDGESVPYRSYDLLENTTGIDLVIDGHSHSVMTEGANGEPIQSTGTALANIGVVVIDNATKAIEDNYLVDLAAYTGSDETVAAAAKAIIDPIDASYGEVFAQSLVDLNGAKAPNGNRDSETNLGDLITDSMVWKVFQNKEGLKVAEENVVAITNGGGIRAPIAKGDVTKKDVNTVLPFGNTIALVYVTGAELLEALEASTYCTPGAVGGFPQVAGIDFTIDTYAEYDANSEPYPGSTYYGPASINRVTINSINGEEFDPAAKYAVISNNFCAAGGDTYYAFAAATEQFDTGIPLDEALMEYITVELGGVIPETYAEPQGRISFASYTDHLAADAPASADRDWNTYVKQAIDDFIATYGGTENAYVVYDFDNTTSIFDVEEQLAVYQLQVMAFEFTPEEMPAILATELGDLNEDRTSLGYG
ncbi:MAG: bifunctional metallophosphatase/5'-nucleotidase, partial [Oscillospiraceae bacterium]|nr:bifunctional metallophosphatase/5'-nucleotidase [Oscillospiraceae bacterium]